MTAPIKDEETNLRIRKRKVFLTKDYPFFSDIIFFMQIHEVSEKEVPTMGVDIKGHLYYNPEWVKKLSDSELTGVLIHECIHPAYLHLIRGKKKENQPIWNIAADCHANMVVAESQFDIPKDVCAMPDRYGDSVKLILKEKDGKVLFNYTVEEVSKKATEEIYDEILNNMPKSLQKMLNEGMKTGSGTDFHIYKGEGDENMSEEEMERLSEEWRQRTTSAAERARQQGKLPASVERMLSDINEPQIDWRSRIYEMTVGGLPSDRTWLRRDRRYAAHGFYVPDQKREGIEVVCGIDTSGSVGDDDMSEFKSENIGIKRAFESVQMKMIFADADVADVLDFDDVQESDIMDARPKGGGGTDMRVITNWVKDNAPDTKVCVIFTDGYTPFPKEHEIPAGMKLLWVICTNGIKQAPKDAAGEFVFMHKK